MTASGARGSSDVARVPRPSVLARWLVGRGVSHRAFLRTMKVVENGIVNDESKTYLDQHDEPITPICLSDAQCSRLIQEVPRHSRTRSARAKPTRSR